jgi:hypothetical protein
MLAWLWTSLYPHDSQQRLHEASLHACTSTLRKRPSKLHITAGNAAEPERTDHPPEETRLDELQRANDALERAQATLRAELSAVRAELSCAVRERDAAECLVASLSAANAELACALDGAHAAARSQSTELLRANACLRIERVESARALETSAAEAASLRAFLDTADGWTGADALQAVQDLNTELIQLAASVADHFAPHLDRKIDYARTSDRTLIGEALGHPVLDLLVTRDHSMDPLVVQLAIQAWEVHCVLQIMDTFCPGLRPDMDDYLLRLFDQMHNTGASHLTSTPS